MADLIDRDAVEDIITNALNGYLTDDVRNTLEGIGIAISDMPSAVVQCKDCYHYDEESEKCILNNSEMKPIDYCSYGSK